MLALLLPLLLQEPSGTVPPFDASKPLSASTLSDEIDRSVHWMRGRFDPAKGDYGGVETNGWVLFAYATCPRRYRPDDGPFVAGALQGLLAAQAQDGSFGSDNWNRVAARALAAMGAAEAAGRVPGGILPAAWDRPERTPEDVLARARELLGTRAADGSFGNVKETARAIAELSWCQAYLAAREPKKAPKPAQALPAFDPARAAETQRALERGAMFLLSQRVEGGFGFDGRRDAGITAMAVGALLALPEPRPAAVQAAIVEGLDFLVGLQQDDGSIHEGQLANYVTSAAILALVRGGRPDDQERVRRATAFLKALQSDEGEGYSEGDRYYGGMGYGGDERPDLSNLQMALEALHAAGTSPSDPAFQKALAFLQRCQNRSESNDLVVVADGKTIAAGNDGGAGYAPGESKAGFVTLADGKQVPRSYGSMSYALLKGYLFAGLAKDDPRVQAVWKWLRENYTLDVNPGFPASDDPAAAYQGLFYYFYTMAKALDLFGEGVLVDAAGVEHDWRSELCARLVAMQRPDGSWINENAARWFEGNPVLATSYALLTLGTARGKP
ncbi:MAG TPA: prenyltransferase/squalene oxidase repeat-containing protein [Planctomycetota bacterium]